MTEEFPRFGIEVTMADMTDVSSYEAAIQEIPRCYTLKLTLIQCSKFAMWESDGYIGKEARISLYYRQHLCLTMGV